MKAGTGLVFLGEGHNIAGTVVAHNDVRFTKRPIMPGDICIIWESGEQSTYDSEFIKENCSVIGVPCGLQPKDEK